MLFVEVKVKKPNEFDRFIQADTMLNSFKKVSPEKSISKNNMFTVVFRLPDMKVYADDTGTVFQESIDNYRSPCAHTMVLNMISDYTKITGDSVAVIIYRTTDTTYHGLEFYQVEKGVVKEKARRSFGGNQRYA